MIAWVQGLDEQIVFDGKYCRRLNPDDPVTVFIDAGAGQMCVEEMAVGARVRDVVRPTIVL